MDFHHHYNFFVNKFPQEIPKEGRLFARKEQLAKRNNKFKFTLKLRECDLIQGRDFAHFTWFDEY
jgi:hypothetical protein